MEILRIFLSFWPIYGCIFEKISEFADVPMIGCHCCLCRMKKRENKIISQDVIRARLKEIAVILKLFWLQMLVRRLMYDSPPFD